MLNELLILQKDSVFLSQLDTDGLTDLSKAAVDLRCNAGDLLIRAGDPSNKVYLVLEGHLISEHPDNPTMPGAHLELGPGQLCGETAFAAGGSHEYDVRALENCRVAMLDREAYNQLMESNPETWKKLEELALQQLRKKQLGTCIDSLFGPFEHLLPYVIQDIEEEIEWLTLRSGETLYDAGDEADSVYILLTGRLLVTNKKFDGREQVLSTVLGGEITGEVALLTKQVRADTVYATRDSDLVRMSKRGFGKMLERNIWAVNRISRSLAKKILHQREPHQANRMPIRSISLIPASASAPVTEIVKNITKVLSRYGQVEVLDRKIVDEALGMPGISQVAETEPAHLRLMQWLHEKEENCRYLIYVGDRSWTAWTERCARQADRLAVLADASSSPDLAEFEQRLSGPRQRWSLVLAHAEDTDRPRDTAKWMDGSSADSVYHARRGNEADLARLARILSGNAVGLVLSGGGARGFAHVGVMRALEELGIPVDLCGGASIGACFGFLLAKGMRADEATDHLHRTWSKKMLDYTLPIASIIAGKRINDRIEKDCLDWDLTDMWVPFFSVSTNITTFTPVVHSRGNGALAVRATSAIPGVLPPVPHDGDLLVDGGVLNNLPIDVMREMNPFGTVIAIDVSAPKGASAKSDFGRYLSGWRLVLNRLHPGKKTPKVPAISSMIMQSMVAGSSQAREEMLRANLADYYQNIHVHGIGMLQFDAVKPAVEIGYRESIGPLREWLKNSGLK
jgi:predicted acylesterase/phospholipase RssA/CRP-like cAMP-binding protein